MSTSRFSNRRNLDSGLTLIELLIAVCIIGLLIGMLLSAALAARETARRIHCTNNLKQISLGLASYATASGAFPGSIGTYSPLARVLPFVDELSLYNAINFDLHDIDTTVSYASVATFQCPSDSSSWSVPGMVNYAVNGGTAALGNAPFSWHRNLPYVSYQHITDGISTTAFASEWLTGVSYHVRDATRSVFQTDSPLVKPSQFSVFSSQCRDLDIRTATINGLVKGLSWASPGFGSSIYNHALLPGEHTCTNGTLTLQGAWTVSSLHSGGVNVAFADGHVTFKKESMERSFWTAIGTMNGHEVVEDR